MAQVVYSPRAIQDLEHLVGFLVDKAPEAAVAAAQVIRDAVDMLERHPLVGRIVTREIRELVISYGRTGYVALYRYAAGLDEVRVLAIRHQRELDYPDQ